MNEGHSMSNPRARRLCTICSCCLALAGAARAQSNPPISSFTDLFNGTTIDASKWTVTATQGTAGEGGGTLNLAPNANTGAAQIIVSGSGSYTLIGSSAYVQVPTWPS
jgi:hypothetical protein